MRWIASAVAGFLVVIVIEVLHYLEKGPFVPLVILLGFLILSNVIYTVFLRKGILVRYLSELQMYSDLVLLTGMLHFSGGIENPMSYSYIFHIILAGILLEPRKCYIIVGVAVFLFGLMAVAEMMKWIDHYTLLIFPHLEEHGELSHAAHRPLYVLSVIGMQFIILSLTAYFTTTIMEQLRVREAEMVQSAKLAALGTIAAGMAHEVGNPLASLSTRIKLLENKHDEYFFKESLKLLQREIGRISRIVHGITRFSRPVKQEKSLCQVNQIIDESIDLLRLHKLAKKRQIKRELCSKPPEILVVKDQLNQAFLNLGLNALEALPEGGQLTIRTDKQDETQYIDYTTKKPVGANNTNGTSLYNSVCASCHGSDGKQKNLAHEPGETEYVGTIANDNPWKVLHKIRFGQPGTAMPSGIKNGWSVQDAVDVLGYAQTLPTE